MITGQVLNELPEIDNQRLSAFRQVIFRSIREVFDPLAEYQDRHAYSAETKYTFRLPAIWLVMSNPRKTFITR
jgi:hypothetical protein